ncbi:hypothetical protein [Kaistella jeonii]|uniref:Uncharacterized protein n=1 Tax=Kaistella jeonii TaxID=266749 RepID=A0A0C1D9D8_9FLAO|nr:hypothetical protein [Kaistella jeonii]KIA90500.1 hypothetical protein OA86_01025 [Kaistella jeonii]SFB71788.1 hypothetical protein SAMN05421876_101326 [Kaistella jeonii]VEI94916.1 Uncharacterised protein [Kaistella jeonii]
MMKIQVIPVFPGNPHLQHILQQVVQEIPIEAIFYRENNASKDSPQLLICTANSKDATTVKARKWVINAYVQTKILINVQNGLSLHHLAKCGNPFASCYCHSDYLIYGDKAETGTLQKIWKKNIVAYKDRFYHDHDLLLTQVHQCKTHESVMGAFLGYVSVYELDLQYLESLYLGSINFEQNLHERIQNLMAYLPILEQMFVKKNAKIFYLIDVLEKSKRVDDEFLLNNELYSCICKTEGQLFALVGERFRELKRMTKQQNEMQKLPEKEEENRGKEMLFEALTVVTEMAEPEEIYHYHTKTEEHQTVYYLLVVGESLSCELLERVQQSLRDKTANKCCVVLVGHRRSWIQENVYLWQGFFKKIMTADQMVYSSNPYHPGIHWEEPYAANYPDLNLYYRAAECSIEQFNVLKKNRAENNYEGLHALFATAFTRILRIYIYRSLSYMPSYVAPEILWKLCLYSKPALEKLEYLFDKVWKERFFLNLNHYLKFNDHLTNGSEVKLEVMEEILEKLKVETEFLMVEES